MATFQHIQTVEPIYDINKKKIYDIYQKYKSEIKEDGLVTLQWETVQGALATHNIEDIKDQIHHHATLRYGNVFKYSEFEVLLCFSEGCKLHCL